MTGDRVDLRLVATSDAAPVARGAVGDLARAAGASPNVLQDVVLAVSEAVTNVVLHAYPPGADGEVRIHASDQDDELHVLVADDGSWQTRPDSAREHFGLRLIERCAAAHRLVPGQKGSRVLMRFDLEA